MPFTLSFELLPYVLTASVVYFACLILYRLTLHPLARFPGPKLAAVSRWYEGYYDVLQGGKYTWKIAKLHQKYGPIIRISPHEIHVIDPDFYEQLYRHDGIWNKYSWAVDAFGASSSTIFTTDHHLHRRRKAAVGSFFSKVAVGRKEGIVRSRVSKLRERIVGHAKSNMPIDIGAAISAMAIDIGTEYVYGASYNNLDCHDFNKAMTDMFQTSGSIWQMTKHVWFWGPIMKALPVSLIERTGDPKIVAFIKYLRTSAAKVKELMTIHNSRKPDASNSSPSLVDNILDSNLPPAEKTFTRVHEDIDMIAGASFESTSAVLRLIIFYLYSNPNMVSRLRNDLNQARLTSPPNQAELSLTQLEHIPFLTAIIMEGLRLSPGIASRMARIAPDRDISYSEWVIPAGTPIGMTTLLMHLNPDIYPDPHSFKPDR